MTDLSNISLNSSNFSCDFSSLDSYFQIFLGLISVIVLSKLHTVAGKQGFIKSARPKVSIKRVVSKRAIEEDDDELE